MANTETVVNVEVDKMFTAAVLRGMADQIPDGITIQQVRELLIDFAGTLENGDNNE